MKKVVLFAGVFVVAAVALLLWSQQRRGPFFVSGFLEADEIRVGSRVGGRVKEVHAIEGQTVRAGDVLVVLEPYDLNERLAQAEGQLAAERARLDKLKAGYLPDEIAQARARRDRAKAVLEKLVAGPRPLEIQMLESKVAAYQADRAKAEFDYDRVRRLFEQKQASEEELQEATRTVDVARARFAQTRDELALAKEGTRAEEIAEARASLAFEDASLALYENGYRAEDIRQAEANVAAGEAARGAIRRQMEELHIVAPGDCVVDAVDLQPGDLAAPNAPVISLVAANSLWVRAYLPENRLNVRVGQKVAIGVDSLPGRRFAGHITFISRKAEFTPSNVQTAEERSKQVFRIKVALDDGLDVLRAGMAADVFLESPP